MSLARGVLGALPGSKASKRGKASGKAPVLLAVLGGLGAAGAAAIKRRQSRQQPPDATEVPPASAGGTDAPPVEGA